MTTTKAKDSSAPLFKQIVKRDLLDVPFALTDYRQTIAAIDEMIERHYRGYICASAVHALMVARHDPQTHAAMRDAALVVPDGRPLVWALNALGAKLTDRVYGPELMRRYCHHSSRHGQRHWLYGGYTTQALTTLEDALRRDHPGIQIVGSYSPPQRALTAAEEQHLIERIHADQPDVVWVGLGAPRQELWMARMRPQLEVPVLIGVGAAFDFLAGLKKQAPGWMQRRGLEWFYRLTQEPRRLLPRYLRYNPAFVAAFLHQYVREKSAGRTNS